MYIIYAYASDIYIYIYAPIDKPYNHYIIIVIYCECDDDRRGTIVL